MARCVIIEGGIVANIAEASPDFAAQQGWVVSDAAQIGHLYDAETGLFSPPPRWPDLTAGKTELHAQINARRDALEEAGFPYLGKTLDSDSRSVQRINTAVQAAQVALAAGQPFSIEWTCADDSTRALDAQGMLGVSVALAMHANALHLHARTLKAQVDAAATSAELEAVDVESGWPA